MKCPICGKELEIMKKQVGTDESGSPIFNQYAVCRDCKKQWNLDKQRAKKAKEAQEAKAASVSESDTTKPIMKKEEAIVRISAENEKAAQKKRPAGETGKKPAQKKRPAGTSETEGKTVKKAAPKKRPVSASEGEKAEQKYANIPPERVRTKKEKAVRQAYEDMLSTDPNYKPKRKKSSDEDMAVSKKAVKKKVENVQPSEKKRTEQEKKHPNTKAVQRQDDYDEDYDDDYDEEFDYMDDVESAKYRVLRVIFGILSVLAFGYFGFKGFINGLDSVASGGETSGSMVYIVLAGCMLVAGLLLLILQNSRNIIAYLLPIMIYLGGGVFAFLKRGDEKILLYSAIAGVVLALILIILAATSRNQDDDYDGDDDYDDPFEDDYE